MESNVITINETEMSFETGETILQIAKRNKIDIPTLCHLKNTIPTTTCRVCLVEIKGMVQDSTGNNPAPESGKSESEVPGSNLVESCATKAVAGMRVFTESEGVIEARKENISRLLASGNHNCSIRDLDANDWTSFQMDVIESDGKDELCPVWGDCELQNLAYKYQVKTKGMPLNGCKYETERANPFIIRDFSRCILCGKCVKACREIQVNDAIEFGYSGKDLKIVAKDDNILKNSDCVFCGECLQVCPVGALIPDTPYRDERFTDTKKVRTTCSFCGVGCQMDLFVQDNKIVKIDGADEDLVPNNASLCVKGRFGFNFVASKDRLTTPLIKKNGKQVEATWDEALDLVASKLSSIKEEFGADSQGVLTSARVTNEENYIAQKFARAVLKTNNVDHCARL